MRRGEPRAEGPKRGTRTGAGSTKAKTRADTSATASAKKLAAKARAQRETSANAGEIATLKRALAEAHEREAATANVLKAISRSSFDLQSVLNTLVESATQLCKAYDAAIVLRSDDTLVFGAHYGPIPVPADFKLPITRGWTAGRAVLDREPVHVDDLLAEESEFPEGHAMSRQMGHRTTFSVPLLRGSEAIGSLTIRRTEARPFTAKQIDLVKNFADQAIIAIETARQFEEVQTSRRELAESLEQQTATSEVLQVISSSPGELESVFRTMLEKATRICGAKFANLLLYEDGVFRRVATYSAQPEWSREAAQAFRLPIEPAASSRQHETSDADRRR
jgi:transcriptional regulator with GAF, ATPase, and Fis domain